MTVEGQYVGRIEGFRFRQDRASSPDEAKTLRQASVAALAPQFHLRADRFYNAPDTEIDVTEQGGLMWGEQAVGKLARGDDPLKPQIVAFVDEEAGAEVAQKVQRRLQHFIDRRIAALFEPLLAMQRDEALEGLAKGFAFRLIEAMGVIPRDEVAGEVKELDQPARGALRKHGVRFGQFTVFLPALLKPAPTRLRLLLWSLSEGFDTFPESPPPGMVTIPVVGDVPEGTYIKAGYRAAGERAIRIDMLERLADLVRPQDSRRGFEATADMLSITGMTLDQFAGLMAGLGYKAEKGEREKVPGPKEQPAAAADPETPAEPGTPTPETPAEPVIPTPEETPPALDPVTDPGPGEPGSPDETPPSEPPGAPDPGPAETPPEPPAETPPDLPGEAPPAPPSEVPQPGGPGEMPMLEGQDEVAAVTDAEAAAALPQPAEPETEVFYTFTWGGRSRGGSTPRGDRAAPRGKGRGRPEKAQKKGGAKPAKTANTRPPRREKPIDPDNPFAAALMGLKDKT